MPREKLTARQKASSFGQQQAARRPMLVKTLRNASCHLASSSHWDQNEAIERTCVRSQCELAQISCRETEQNRDSCSLTSECSCATWTLLKRSFLPVLRQQRSHPGPHAGPRSLAERHLCQSAHHSQIEDKMR